jgi:hypothetical protein
MKKRSGVGREVPVFQRQDLESMPTKMLLARLDRLRFCEESAATSDLSKDEVGDVSGILFKDSAEWRQAYDDVKQVLATREHIPRRR